MTIDAECNTANAVVWSVESNLESGLLRVCTNCFHLNEGMSYDKDRF